MKDGSVGVPRLTHPSGRCVAELRVSGSDGITRVGSGYLVDRGWVLTSAHVVRGMTSVRVWVDPQLRLRTSDECSVDVAGIRLAGDGADWALVPVPDHEPPEGFVPVLFAEVDRTSDEPIPVIALGMPRFKLREPLRRADESSQPPRDMLREIGAFGAEIRPMGNQRTGTLTMAIVGAPAPQTTERSIWEGMSGAAVWAGDLVIGVVAQHHLAEGTGSLTVHPLSRSGGQADSPRTWRTQVPNLDRPALISSRARMVQTTYQRVARRLAPAVLSGRSKDLTALDEFAAGTERWRWYSADAFAGKTALLSWWSAHHQDQETVVVAAFLRRSAGLNSAKDVIGTLTVQLGAVAGLPASELRTLQLQSADASALSRLEELLESAALRCRRLVVVIDGLDEYEPIGQIPVAEWLPGSLTLPLPLNAALLVSSRLGAPTGIPDDHPLRFRRTQLTSSPVAAEFRRQAENEINHALQDPGRLDARIVGLLAAAEGPLSHDDLTALIKSRNPGVYASDIRLVWNRYLARTLTSSSGGHGYEFSHDALREYARSSFAGDLPAYREDLHLWADGYADQNWPEETPPYLLTGYLGMLRAERDADRLVPIVTDRQWQIRVRAMTGGDAIALADLNAAIRLLISDPRPSADCAGTELCTAAEPDLVALARCVWNRDQLEQRNEVMPAMLPAIWAYLGHYAKAESLAGAVIGTVARVEAFVLVAVAQCRAGLFEDARKNFARAEQEAETVQADVWFLKSCSVLVAALVGVGEYDEARRIAASVRAQPALGPLLTLAESLAEVGEGRQAVAAAREAEQLALVPEYQLRFPARGLAWLVAALASADQFVEAERIAGDIIDLEVRAEAQLMLSAELAKRGHAAEADRIATMIEDPPRQVLALAVMATVSARAGETGQAATTADDALRLVAAVGEPDSRAEVLTALIPAMAALGRVATVSRFTAEVEVVVQTLPQRDKYRPLGSLVEALAGIGQFAEARRVCGTIADLAQRAKAMLPVLSALTAAGQVDGATAVVGEVVDLTTAFLQGSDLWHDEALAEIAVALTEIGHHDAAEEIVAKMTGPSSYAEAQTSRAAVLLEAGDHLRAAAVADLVEQFGIETTDPYRRAHALTDLAGALESAGAVEQARPLAEQARRVVERLADRWAFGEAKVALAGVLIRTGNYSAAESFADGSVPHQRVDLLTDIAVAHIRSGANEAAAAIMAKIEQTTDPDLLAGALTALAATLADSGRYEDAEQLATKVEGPDHQAEVLLTVATRLITADDTDGVARLIQSAGQLVDMIPDGHRRGRVSTSLAMVLAEAGRYAEAEQAATTIDSEFQRADALTAVAALLIDTGQDELAADVVRKAEQLRNGFNHNAWALTRLAIAYVRSGRTGEAERLTALVTDPSSRARMLVMISAALNEDGQVEPAQLLAEQAERLVAKINDHRQRTGLTEVLASTLADCGMSAVARRLVAALWVEQPWSTALATVAKLEPAALIALAQAQLAQAEPAYYGSQLLPRSRS
ncbi:trypsin-like peptidase domain-containing protein [Kribbella sp. NPDC056861]|uniref:trypsin-like peptidase domain-containing protein n=1 Tax=Kribbella sp. NPDC056861 TaxID=3154857 RepID=UPI00342DA876